MSSLYSELGRRISESADGHWYWTLRNGVTPAARNGTVCFKGKPVARWVYEVMYGTIPDGHIVERTCAFAGCVKPEHLRAVGRAKSEAGSTGFFEFSGSWGNSLSFYPILDDAFCLGQSDQLSG